jgi:hypothetical protein
MISYCGNFINNDLEKKIIKHDNYNVLTHKTYNNSFLLKNTIDYNFKNKNQSCVLLKTNSKVLCGYSVNKNTKKEQKPLKSIKKEEIKNNNKFYFVNDNGYKRYLDKKYQKHLLKMCKKYKVEKYYKLFIAQMYHESGFNTNIISQTKDYGLMQINICNHKWLGKKFNNNDFLNPYNNIEAGVYMMSIFLHKYNNVEKALVCYNRGEYAVKKGIHSTTYSKGVLSDMKLVVELKK